MARTSTGNRHQIIITVAPSGIRNVQAICVCQKLNAPKRFDRRDAEEDGHDHLLEFAKQGKPAKKGRK